VTATLEIERYLKGSGPGRLQVIYTDRFDRASFDQLLDYSDHVGQKQLLFLHVWDPPVSETPAVSRCDSNLILDAPRDSYGDELVRLLAAVEAITGPGRPPDESLSRLRLPNDPSFPYLPAAVAATLGPLAFLAGAAFVWGRKRGAG